MKGKISYILLLLATLFIFSCKKEEPEMCISEEEPEQWERFIGDYLVYDTTGVFLYEMTISNIYSGLNEWDNPLDSILLENFAGKFDYKYKFQNSQLDSYMDLGSQNPLVDYEGNRWYFWSNSDDLETDVIENTLINDTIVFYFLLDNTPYWPQDGVFYYSCDCKHIAVKQN